MWSKLSNNLMENNHVKIPIEKRFFLTFIEDYNNNIQKQKIIDELHKNGFYENDPRLHKFFSNLKLLVKGSNVNYEEFKHCVENHICILKQILSKECIIPRFNIFCNKIKNIYDETIKHEDGNNANYIPQ